MSIAFDLTNIGLSDGTYSVTAIAKAGGYADSTESEAVNYVRDDLAGTWSLNVPLPVNSVEQVFYFDGTMPYGIDIFDNYDYYTGRIRLSLRVRDDESYMLQLSPVNDDGSTIDGFNPYNTYYYKTSGGYSVNCTMSGGNVNNYFLEDAYSSLGRNLRKFTINSLLAEVANGDALVAYLQANATKTA